MTTKVQARAPGKVNLHLAVGERREDGYHPLATIFQAVGVWETVTASARDDGEYVLTLDTTPAVASSAHPIPLDDTNLAVRAARMVAGRYGISDGVDLRIKKDVPVAGGMAGGSADAAAALVACAHLWEVGATRDELMELGAALGADVPFALLGHTAVGVDRGDELSPAMTRGEFHWVFATSSKGLSTPTVFAEFDRQVDAGHRAVTEPQIDGNVMRALMAGDAHALGASLSNDLQSAALALAPYLQLTIDAALEADALGAIISGSGPTVAALGRSRQHALAIAAHISAVDVANSVFTASGPVAGASVISSGH